MRYAKERTTFGKPIGARQAIAFAISDLAVAVEAARTLTYKAAWLKDAGRPAAQVKQAAAIAKLYSTEAAVSATRTATQVFGGYGFMEEYPVARFYRDAKILEIGEGTSEVQRMVIARGARPAGRVACLLEEASSDVRCRQGSRGAGGHAGTARQGGREAGGGATSCTSGTASRCCSTRVPSSRTRSWPTRSAVGLPADGVVTGQGLVDGRPALVVANDPTVKAGSWGARTVEKIIRITERALVEELPIFWLIDSAGARITDQVALFPGRRGAGRIFHNQVALSGKVPQICCLFGPSAAGGAYIPAFCDIVIMVEANASMYLGSPRMAEMVVGEKVSLEEMGGARMHATVSGCGDNLAVDDADAIEQAKLFFSYLPANWRSAGAVGTRPSRRWSSWPTTWCRWPSRCRSTCTS